MKWKDLLHWQVSEEGVVEGRAGDHMRRLPVGCGLSHTHGESWASAFVGDQVGGTSRRWEGISLVCLIATRSQGRIRKETCGGDQPYHTGHLGGMLTAYFWGCWVIRKIGHFYIFQPRRIFQQGDLCKDIVVWEKGVHSRNGKSDLQ